MPAVPELSVVARVIGQIEVGRELDAEPQADAAHNSRVPRKIIVKGKCVRQQPEDQVLSRIVQRGNKSLSGDEIEKWIGKHQFAQQTSGNERGAALQQRAVYPQRRSEFGQKGAGAFHRA